MMHARFKDWPARLAAFIEERRRMPFRWGQNDCGLFGADATRAMTGIDPASAIRGYRTALGAARLTRNASTRDPGDPFGVRELPMICGFEEIPVARAGRGDLVVVPMGKGLAVGVCLGMNTAGPGEEGIEFVPTSTAVAAWRF